MFQCGDPTYRWSRLNEPLRNETPLMTSTSGLPAARSIRAVLATVLLSTCPLAVPATAETRTPTTYIVMLKDGPPPGSRQMSETVTSAVARARSRGATIEREYQAIGGYAAEMTPDQAARTRRDPSVLSISPDVEVHLAGMTPADDFWPPREWGLDRLDQRELPLSGTPFQIQASGVGVHAYIIDTGIHKTHTEFTGRIGNGYDFVSNDEDAQDDHNFINVRGHGSMSASIVGGTRWGVAKKVTLHPVKAMDSMGSGKGRNVIAAIDWVTANGVRPGVVNMSIDAKAWEEEDTAVRRMVQAGFVVAGAAGNSRDDTCGHTPGRVTEILTVAAGDHKDRMAGFSGWGSCVDLFAPGFFVGGASNKNDTACQWAQGTSQSTPYVAGTAAAYLEKHPTATMAEVHKAVIDMATAGRMNGDLKGSPDRILYTGGITAAR